ncbi:MAG: Gfo/Idh/MocA family oxidoreductase, partial [Acutalibacteraceae bacterium]
MDKLKVAVIGCGNISVMHLDAIVALEESELAAVCDIKPDRAEQTAERYG